MGEYGKGNSYQARISVMPRKYWSIPTGVLEYFYRSTLTTPVPTPPTSFVLYEKLTSLLNFALSDD